MDGETLKVKTIYPDGSYVRSPDDLHGIEKHPSKADQFHLEARTWVPEHLISPARMPRPEERYEAHELVGNCCENIHDLHRCIELLHEFSSWKIGYKPGKLLFFDTASSYESALDRAETIVSNRDMAVLICARFL